MSRVRSHWIVYRNDHAPVEPMRHLICESCRGETECGLRIGDNRATAFNDASRWYTAQTHNYHLPACSECQEMRAQKIARGYRLRVES